MKYINELYQTPEILELVLQETPEEQLIEASLLVFCGCGTSFYLGQQMSKLCNAQGRNAIAIEAVELIEANLPFEDGAVFVFISRSGNSMETVLAMQAVRAAGAVTFYLGCTKNSKLFNSCDNARVLPYAKESLILESYSFYAQLLGLAICCGLTVSKNIPELVHKALQDSRKCYNSFIKGMKINRMICLGAPFYMPLLKEIMLKNGEITGKFSEHWGILEFRHGPRSWADEHCLITVISGEVTQTWDFKAAQELICYGSRVLWYGEKTVQKAYPIELDVPRQSIEEILALGAFQVGIAAEIGLGEGQNAENLRNISYCVEVL